MIEKKEPWCFGLRIAQHLASSGNSRKWLADQCGVTVGMIGHIITGHALPSLPVAIKICKALNCTLDDVFFEPV